MGDLNIWKTTLLSAVFSLVCWIGCVPDVGEYHTYEELEDDLHSLAEDHPGIAKLLSIGNSVEGRELWALKVSDNVDLDEPEPAVAFFGGHHGREWISVEVPYLIAEHLVEQYELDSRIKEMIDSCEIWIVPLVNPDGHQYSITTNRFWRKNRRDNGDGTFGVDLNRNYGFEWGGAGASADTFSQTYSGTEPFSEPETKAVRDFVNAREPDAVLSYHNWGQWVLYPWGYTDDPAPDHELLAELGGFIADEISGVCDERYMAMQSSEHYLLSGGAIDWIYAEHSVPAYDIELRSASQLPGFMLPADEIQATFDENLPGALFLVDWVLDQQTLGGQ